MRTKHRLIIGTIGVILAGALFTGCSKDTKAPTNVTTTPDYTASEDEANASFVVNDTKNISDGAAKGQAVDRTLNGYPVLYKRDTNNHTDSLLDIYFGPTDVVCADGVTRRGHVLVWYLPNSYWTLSSVITMGFKNYYVTDIGVTGLRSLTNMGTNAWKFNANLVLKYTNNDSATWNSTREDTVKTVNSVAYWTISGSAFGLSRTGATYQIAITSPLYYELPWWLSNNQWPTCLSFESGKLTVTVSNYPYPLYVTLGTGIGTCSNSAVATINNTNYNFSQLW